MIDLTREEILLVIEALDSHEYWQLSDPLFRNEGRVRGAGSEDERAKDEIERVRRLRDRLERLG